MRVNQLVAGATPAPLVDHTSYRAEGERFTRAVLGNAQKPWVSERRRRTPARIRYRRHTTIDQDARGIAERSRRLPLSPEFRLP